MTRRVPLFLILCSTVLSACSMNRMTTTSRTAIEQALLARSAQAALAKFRKPNLAGKSFCLERQDSESVEEQQMLTTMMAFFLREGLALEPNPEQADLIIQPWRSYGAIDDNDMLIGLPSLAVPLPMAGTITTPELALLKINTQRASHEIGYIAYHHDTGKLAFEQPPVWGQKLHRRWTILVLIKFRTTQLGDPF
jgi:hypothetical protein